MFHIVRPPGFNCMLEVSGCFVRHRDKFIILKRQSDCRWGDCWDFPGGVRQGCESPKQTAVREVREETGIVVMPEQLVWIGKFYFAYPDISFTYDLYDIRLARKPRIRVNPQEHENGLLVTPNEALDFRLLRDFENLIAIFFTCRKGGGIGISPGPGPKNRRPSGRRQPGMC